MPKHSLINPCILVAAATVLTAQDRSPAPPGPPATRSGSASSAMVSAHTVAPVTADLTLAITNPDGSVQNQQGHYYRSSNGNIREDSPAGSVITDFKAGTITTLNPATNQAIVRSTPGPKGRYVQPNPPPATPTVTVLGNTTVEGHPVIMKSITLDPSNGQTTEIWTATDIRLTVLLKATSPGGQTVTRQYQNIQLVEPDPGLFAIPQGYTVITNPSNGVSTSASGPPL